MNNKFNYLLIGNTRLHWAENINNSYRFCHTEINEPFPKNLKTNNLVWASVGNYQTERFDKKNEITINNFNTRKIPKNFGVDRALCCLYALKKFDNPMKKNLLIADFGTVLSITKLNADGFIIGGQLIPGFLTQLKSMGKSTKNLNVPDILKIPKNKFQIKTSQAMLKGVHDSLIGAISMSFNYRKDILIICGGDAELMSKSLKQKIKEIKIEPNLVMLGMIFAHKNKINLRDF
tara:strand:- start:2255 stop:2956 length:702 start_codon:yes stop_codon:yes gene_type:complete